MHSSPIPLIRVEQVSLASRLPPVSGNSRSGITRSANGPIAGLPYLLKDISFDVSLGDRISIVGSSGAGKTTLLRLLNRLSEPTQGAIYLDGRNYAQIPVISLRKQIVLVLQESRLLGMTVRQSLEYPLRLRQLPKQDITQRVDHWIDRLHIPSDWLHRTEPQLSVGQRQLVAIARALMAQPKALLLDEPTSAQDAGRSHFILNVLAELAEVGNVAVLMVNHQLDLAKQFSNRVLYLQQGNLLEDVPTLQMNWETLKQKLIQAEAEQKDEWGE